MEPTLAIAFKELKGDLGFHLGYGRGADFGDTAFTTQQEQNLAMCIKGGMRRFYYPAVEGLTHTWSFLKPSTRLTLPSGESRIRLPDDFSFLDGPIIVVGDDTVITQIPLVNHGTVRAELAAYPDTTGYPVLAAWIPVKDTTATRGQRFDLILSPKADQDYTLEFEYSINPNFLTGEYPYAYGGPQHAQTLLQACRAEAENVLDDHIGVQTQLFEQRLLASLDMDRKAKPQNLGYNRDRSDDKYSLRSRSWVHGRNNLITFDGVEP